MKISKATFKFLNEHNKTNLLKVEQYLQKQELKDININVQNNKVLIKVMSSLI